MASYGGPSLDADGEGVAGTSGDDSLALRAKPMPPPSGDEELRSRADDGLSRTSFADAIAAQIASVHPERAVVFGLVGPWGSGKTSLLNMIAEALKNDHEGIEVAEFNPWLFSGTDHLVGIFFEELGARLREKGERWKTVGQAMEGFGELLGSLRSVPVAGPWVGPVGSGLKLGGRLLGRKDKQPDSLASRKEKLKEALRQTGKRIVVMVDDLDRLRHQEIRDVVALVRLNADLPNVLFLLAYDRGRVEKALREVEGDGRSYLEKIVQVVHDVPEAREIDLKGALLDAVSEIIEAAPTLGPYDPHRVSEVLQRIVLPLMSTVRDVKRYTNALPVTLRTVGEEVALADVVGLEAMRLFLPEVYSRLSESAVALTTPSDAYPLERNKDRDKELVRSLIEAGADRSGVVDEACELLFPAGLELLHNNHYTEQQDDGAGRERRVASWRFLRFFLDKRLPQGVLPARRVQEVFDAFGEPERLRLLLEKENLEGIHRLMLRLHEYEDVFQPREVMEAVPAISDRHARLMFEAGRTIDLETDFSYGGLMRRMLGVWQDPEQLAYQLKTILPRIDSLSARAELVSIVGHRPNLGEKLVSEEDAGWFEGNMVTALENAPKEALAKEYALARLLAQARQHDEERAERLISRLAEDDGVFLSALLPFYNRSETGLEDGPMQERSPTLRWDDVCSLFGEDTMKRRVDELRRKSQPEDLGEPAAEILYLADLYASGRPPAWERRR